MGWWSSFSPFHACSFISSHNKFSAFIPQQIFCFDLVLRAWRRLWNFRSWNYKAACSLWPYFYRLSKTKSTLQPCPSPSLRLTLCFPRLSPTLPTALPGRNLLKTLGKAQAKTMTMCLLGLPSERLQSVQQHRSFLRQLVCSCCSFSYTDRAKLKSEARKS